MVTFHIEQFTVDFHKENYSLLKFNAINKMDCFMWEITVAKKCENIRK